MTIPVFSTPAAVNRLIQKADQVPPPTGLVQQKKQERRLSVCAVSGNNQP